MYHKTFSIFQAQSKHHLHHPERPLWVLNLHTQEITKAVRVVGDWSLIEVAWIPLSIYDTTHDVQYSKTGITNLLVGFCCVALDFGQGYFTRGNTAHPLDPGCSGGQRCYPTGGGGVALSANFARRRHLWPRGV